ncbi:MAG: 2-amino-4-hydroxy-6-hydroxymethyldihydropteridine diphosphokinase [Alphaproteobacteria bacterium]
MSAPVLIALGSNLGNSLAILDDAIDELSVVIDQLECSDCYCSKPKYVENQPDFYNMVVRGNTLLSPLELLSHLKAIEDKLGRVPSFKNGPRALDLDIILFDQQMIKLPALELPHPKFQERGFVLMPAVQIAADWLCPRNQKRLDHLFETLPKAECEQLYRIDRLALLQNNG